VHWTDAARPAVVTADGAEAAAALRDLRLDGTAPTSATVAEDATAPGAAR
jgi:hypothetical protein